ncbi:MAG: hypothetical protein Q9165_003979 [Trypethelium subeluteriae]
MSPEIAPVGRDGHDVWQQAIGQLDPELKQKLDLVVNGRRDVLSAALQEAERKLQLSYKCRWKVKIRGKEIVIRDILDKIVGWIRKFRDVGDIAIQYSPVHAALPWAAVRFLLQTSITESELHSGIVGDLEMITRLLARFKVFEKLHITSIAPLELQIEDALVGLYATILERLAFAVKYFKERAGKRLLKALFGSMDEEFRRKIEAKEDEVLKLAGLNDIARSISTENNIVRLCDLALVSEKQVEEAQFFEILDWLSPLPFMREHENVKQGRMLESERERRSPEDVLRSVVRQLTVSTAPQRSIHDSILSCYERKKARAKLEGTPSDVSKLRTSECIDLILETLDNNPASIFIDALDEMAEDRRYEMLSALNEIVRKSANVVKVFLTSRDDSTIFDMLPEAQLLRVSKSENAADIEHYTQMSVDTATAEMKLLKGRVTTELRDRLVSSLVGGAGEMFIWVKMQLSRMCRLGHEQDIVAALADISSVTLEELYRSTFERMRETGSTAWSIALRTFSWLLYMREPLTADDLPVAISAASEWTLPTPADLIRLCFDLVQLGDSAPSSASKFLRFTHHSVQQFLRGQPELEPICGHRILASSSLVICNIGPPTMTAGMNGTAVSKAVYDYAVVNWPHHLKQTDLHSSDEGLYNQTEAFVFGDDEPSLMFALWLQTIADTTELLPREHPYKDQLNAVLSKSGSPIFALSVFGLQTLIEYHDWSTNFDWNQRNNSGQTPLYLASYSGNEGLVRTLVERGAEINVECGKRGSPLHVACFHGYVPTVEMLLSHSADIMIGDVYETAFDAAFRGDREDTALALLKSGYTIPTQDVYDSVLSGAAQAGFLQVIALLQKSSAFSRGTLDKQKLSATKAIASGKVAGLRFLTQKAANLLDILPSDGIAVAAAYGHTAMIDFLLDSELAIEAPGPLGSPLRSACLIGHEPSVRTLIDRGANVNTNDSHGNALHAAAMKGNTHIVRLLVRNGANVNLSGDFYGTALQAAAFRGHKDIVQVLLDAHADVYAGGYTKDTFHAASHGGHHDVVMLLLRSGFTFHSPLPEPAAAFRPTMPLPRDIIAETSPTRQPDEYELGAREHAVEDFEASLKASDDPPSLDMGHILQLMERPALTNHKPRPTPYKNRMAANLCGKSRNFAFRAAASLGHLSVVQGMINAREEVDLLADNGSELDITLLEAASKGHSVIVDIILRSNIAVDWSLQEALEAAARSGDLSSVETIIRYTPSKTITRRHLKSALINACAGSHVVASRILDLWNVTFPESELQALMPRMLKIAAEAGNSKIIDMVLCKWKQPIQQTLRAALKKACSSSSAASVLSIGQTIVPTALSPSPVSECLRNAAAAGYCDLTHAVLVTFEHISSRDLRMEEAICYAAAKGHVQVVELLLHTLGKDVSAAKLEITRRQALMTACLHDQYAVCILLISAGTDVNGVAELPCLDISRLFRRGLPLPSRSGPHRSIGEEYYEDSEEEFRRNESAERFSVPADYANEFETSAAGRNTLNALQACLQGFNQIEVQHQLRNKFGDPLLHGVEQSEERASRERILRLLVDNGSDVNALGGGENYPLCMAAKVCSAECIAWLIDKGANVNLCTGGVTALDVAADREIESMAIMRTLFDSGAGEKLTTKELQRLLKISLKFPSDYPLHSDTLRTFVMEGPGAVVSYLLRRDLTILAEGKEFAALLQMAAVIGERSYIELLIQRKVEVDFAGFYYGSTLQAACRFGHTNIIKTLIHAGADPNIIQGKHQTALRAAVKSGHIESVRLLLDNPRTDIELAASAMERSPRQRPQVPHDVRAPLSNTILNENSTFNEKDTTPFQLAVQLGHVQLALTLLAAGAKVNASHLDAQDPLIAACGCGNAELVRNMILRGANVQVKGKCKKGYRFIDDGEYSPLHMAIARNNEDIVRLLLGHGVDPTAQFEHGPAPLVLAASRGNCTIVEALLQSLPKSPSHCLNLALSEAATNGRLMVVNQLLDHGALILDSENNLNAVIAAGRQGHCQIMEPLLDELSASDLKETCARVSHIVRLGRDSAAEMVFNYAKCTKDVLVAACIWNRKRIAQLALEQGVAPNAEDSTGCLPLHAAAYCGNVELVELLISSGADLSRYCSRLGCVVRAALEGFTATALREYDRPDECKRLADQLPRLQESDDRWASICWYRYERSRRRETVDYEKVVQKLLDHGAQADTQPGIFGTALHLAAFAGLEATFNLLLAQGARIETRGGYFGTVFAATSESGNNSILQLALRGDRIGSSDPCIYTSSLLSACKMQNVTAMKLLLDEGADPNATGSQGKTPLSVVLTERDHSYLYSFRPLRSLGDEEESALDVLLKPGMGLRVTADDLLIAASGYRLCLDGTFRRLLECENAQVVTEQIMIAFLRGQQCYEERSEVIQLILDTRRFTRVTDEIVNAVSESSILRLLLDYDKSFNITTDTLQLARNRECLQLLLERGPDAIPNEQVISAMLRQDSLDLPPRLSRPQDDGSKHIIDMLWERNPALKVTEDVLAVVQKCGDLERLLSHTSPSACPITKTVLDAATNGYGKSGLLRLLLAFDKTVAIPHDTFLHALSFSDSLEMLEILLQHDADLAIDEEIFLCVFRKCKYGGMFIERKPYHRLIDTLQKFSKRFRYTSRIRAEIDTTFQKDSDAELRRRFNAFEKMDL